MTYATKLMCGLILLTVPTIQYGGLFLLRLLSGGYSRLGLSDFQKSMFRAGHAHAGVLVILSLIVQVLAEHASLSQVLEWIVRIGLPLSTILISVGFFASAIGDKPVSPNKFIAILYAGVVILAFSLILLGIGLINSGS